MMRTLQIAVFVSLIAMAQVSSRVTHADNGTTENNKLLELSCQDIDRSNFIDRVCYDEAHQYMVIRLTGKLYHYCDIEPEIIRAFLSAPVMGEFYNSHIKGRKTARPYDCRK